MTDRITISKFNLQSGRVIAVVPLSDELAKEIARFNGYLTAEQVKETLAAGKSVSTSFNHYRRHRWNS